MPMHSRKKLQKKETSTPIPKKYLEYEVSEGVIVRGSTLIETTHPGQAPQLTIYMSCFMTGGPDKEQGTNKSPPTRRVRERSKGDTTCLTTSQNPSLWH